MISPFLYLFDATINLLEVLINIAVWVILIAAALSWLIRFDVINTRNRTVYEIVSILDRITLPMLSPIRRFMPNLGGVDISPIILLLLLKLALIPALEAFRMLVHNLASGQVLG